uniref:hypothetical protein n=1 Tax=Flavobacterium sp. TaxID=239 RepID=UPI00404A2E66
MKLDNNQIIEIYKELGLYERHFNQIQNVFKGLASTWFLAGFTGIGYIFSTEFNSLPVNPNFASSLICLVISTGILLFWMMDVLVYHKLLRATLETGEFFKSKNKIKQFIILRENFKHYTKGLNVRTAMSLFYIVPCLILVVGSFYFLLKIWTTNTWYNNTIILVWLSAIIISSFLIIIFQKRKSTKHNNV